MDINESVDKEIRKRLFVALANAGYFESDKVFLSSVEHSHLELSDLTELSEVFPKLSFPSSQKSARNVPSKRTAEEAGIDESNASKSSKQD